MGVEQMVCGAGHVIEISDFSPPDGVIAAIAWCPAEVPHAPAGLIYECGERVLWVRNPKPDRAKILRWPWDKQLDLFWDLTN